MSASPRGTQVGRWTDVPDGGLASLAAPQTRGVECGEQERTKLDALAPPLLRDLGQSQRTASLPSFICGMGANVSPAQWVVLQDDME